MYGMPAREVQRSDQVSDVSQQAASSDLVINNLSFHQPEALSLAVNRSYSRQFFQRRSYVQGETAVIDMNSGTDYVDPGNSYLTFTVTLAADADTATAGWGIGSAMNVVRQVTIKSRSGTELDRVERANLWSCIDTNWRASEAWLVRQGPLEGYRQSTTVMNRTVARRYCIPLKRLAPFFRPIVRGQKIPPQLMSGLHMELIFESFPIALQQGAGAGTISGYTIGDLALMLDSCCLTDDAQKVLNDQSASDGLEYSYPRVFTSIDAVPSTQVSTQVRKAVSQALLAYAVSLNTANDVIANDSFQSTAWQTTSFQFRLGALYFPIQAIQDATADGSEAYAQAIETFDKYKANEIEPAVSLADFVGTKGVMAVSLEKDTALNLSGLPVNNSRVLELLATLNTATATRNIVTFLEYVAVSRSYIDNAAVSI